MSIERTNPERPCLITRQNIHCIRRCHTRFRSYLRPNNSLGIIIVTNDDFIGIRVCDFGCFREDDAGFGACLDLEGDVFDFRDEPEVRVAAFVG